ncbi:MAG: mandelate racemase [Chloroflexia bacterium]|nr:mandelate racemase [Chloroflexia bacterium]
MKPVITRIDMATIEGTRARAAGSNARLGHHGDSVRLPLVRLTTSDGAVGFGRSRASEDQLRALLGQVPADLFASGRVLAEWTFCEFPLLDLAARQVDQPVCIFAGGTPRQLRSYDTSLYFDDLHLADDAAAAALIANEARDGWDLGHRAFKIKVGRGARHMPLESGTARDITIIQAVRDAVGSDAAVMIDANNGWNLNLTKRVLHDTAGANLHWIEEAFHEDNVLYADLKEWLAAEGLAVRIADGEGAFHPALAAWAVSGVVDVVQPDIFDIGFTHWLELGAELDRHDVASSPHTYGGGIGPYVVAHLAGLVRGVTFLEWDDAAFAEIDASAWSIRDGVIDVPTGPGFGLELDHHAFDAVVSRSGVTLRQ